MHKLSEELLHFIWRHRLLKSSPLVTVSGSSIEIIRPGDLNADAGPDFFNGQIRINGLVLAGNIELHVKTSDWLKHQHCDNKNYDHIILHAVYEHDVALAQNAKHNVEVLELKSLISESTIVNYEQLSRAKTRLACSSQLKDVNDLKWASWLERMTVERLEEKVKRIDELFAAVNNDYTQTFYTLLLRNFGFKVNALPFELLAKQLPFNVLLKHADNLMQLEALLFGVCGFLEGQLEDKYLRALQNEFEYLKVKYGLKPLEKNIFKFSKMRPANFPSQRLAQLAQLVHTRRALFTGPQLVDNYQQLCELLQINNQGYWRDHYTLDGKRQNKPLSFGKDSAENLVVNTFAPFFFFYAKKTDKPRYADLSLQLLADCYFESNTKTRLFESKKVLLKTSAHSQALINLYDHYCSKKACLKCGVAAAILSNR